MLVLAAACVHAPPSRHAAPGETFAFDAIEVRAPAEAGWIANDWVVGGHRELTLLSKPAVGGTVRHAWVREQEIPGAHLTRQELIGALPKRVDEVPGASLASFRSGQAPVSLDERFGALGARMSLCADGGKDDSAAAGGVPARYLRYVFVPPGWPNRLYLVQYGESVESCSAAAGVQEGFDRRAGDFFDGVRLRPPSTQHGGALPEGRERREQSFALGAGAWRLRGVGFVGGSMHVGSGFSVLAGSPSGGARLGGELQATMNAGGDSAGEHASLVGTVTVLAFASHGPFRAGGGLDVGIAVLDRLQRHDVVPGFVIGPRVFASADLHRWRTTTLYLAVDGLAATPNLFQATGLVGMR